MRTFEKKYRVKSVAMLALDYCRNYPFDLMGGSSMILQSFGLFLNIVRHT